MNSELTQQLTDLRLSTLMHSLMLQEEQPHLYSDLSFHDRLSLLLGEEITIREQRKVERLVKQAKFRLSAHPSHIDYRASRGIEKSKIRSLLEGHWLKHHQNLIFTGATGCGKTYLGCAIGHYFCQQGMAVRYFRIKGLQEHLRQVHGDGSYTRFLNQLNKTPILILDDWGMETLTTQQRSDLLDIIDARHEQGSIIIMSQLPVVKWHALIGEATYADAIMDRLIHRAQRFELKGESMRKLAINLTEPQ
ncbi:MAG: ATP-binding protein [Moritella sp.]|uniref:IS21-like element helper ATPase IstB n=1 Tax=Moritella sp. TaxID=78556 RepID=UPI001D7048F7|nr:IS21-like element helper ATPase IstB [Moritella sp.]NQZ52480.1 ATP-binding protein [Moritella sp.]